MYSIKYVNIYSDEKNTIGDYNYEKILERLIILRKVVNKMRMRIDSNIDR